MKKKRDVLVYIEYIPHLKQQILTIREKLSEE